MEIPGVRFECIHNVEMESGVGHTVGELKEFLSTVPDEAEIVWCGSNERKLIFLSSGIVDPKIPVSLYPLYVAESTKE